MEKFGPVTEKVPHMLHGGDYNPDQWLEYPQVLEDDVRLMNLAGINSASVGIFAWAALEPREGVHTFDWLDAVMDRLHKKGVSVILATPSGARPAWMDEKYPEVLRVGANRVRNLHGFRHNHCFTSPYYRMKTQEINALLAERYKNHPALTMWHLSNEYGGECHCPLCQQAFRDWLRKKYGDIENLNRQWWTSFWSHHFNSFDQVESPAPHGETQIHGLNLDWKRFVTWQTTEFMKNETVPLRRITPNIPVTTNFMGTYPGLDYWKMADAVDVISWDNYPLWHNDVMKVWENAANIGFVHDINRCHKQGRPFMLMESTPSQVNWTPVNKLKRPGMNALSSIQAIAHGSDTVQYFQWRKSRGASEKLHGAVVDHCGHEHTRVFKEVAELGSVLKKLDGVVGTSVRPQAAVIYDWENRWIIDDLQGLNNQRRYEETCKDHYRAFWKRGIPTDVISMDCDFSSYKLVVAPMLYMLKPTVAKRLEAFVSSGGTLVTTYFTGYANENDLCFLGGFPGEELRSVIGIWAEEIDPLYPSDENSIVFLKKAYRAHTMCETIHAEGKTEVLATYGGDFYAGSPAVTKNAYGAGTAYHIAARTDFDLLDDFYGMLITSCGVKPLLDAALPEGVTVQTRYGGGETYLFVSNFTDRQQRVTLNAGVRYTDLVSGKNTESVLSLASYAFYVLKAE